jgi:hypothetical protein
MLFFFIIYNFLFVANAMKSAIWNTVFAGGKNIWKGYFQVWACWTLCFRAYNVTSHHNICDVRILLKWMFRINTSLICSFFLSGMHMALPMRRKGVFWLFFRGGSFLAIWGSDHVLNWSIFRDFLQFSWFIALYGHFMC